MLFNTIIFIIVIAVLIKQIRRRRQMKHSSYFKSAPENLIKIIGIASIFGLTWLFGAFTVKQKTQLAFLILFVLFSSFQGFFIFVFLCVMNKDTRELWSQFLIHGRCSKKANSSNISTGKLDLHKYYQTASSTPKYSSDQYSPQKSRIEIRMFDTTDELVYVKEGALDIDTEVSTNT